MINEMQIEVVVVIGCNFSGSSSSFYIVFYSFIHNDNKFCSYMLMMMIVTLTQSCYKTKLFIAILY